MLTENPMRCSTLRPCAFKQSLHGFVHDQHESFSSKLPASDHWAKQRPLQERQHTEWIWRRERPSALACLAVFLTSSVRRIDWSHTGTAGNSSALDLHLSIKPRFRFFHFFPFPKHLTLCIAGKRPNNWFPVSTPPPSLCLLDLTRS